MILAAIRGCEQARHELDDVCTRYSVAQDATKDAANEAAKRAIELAKRKVKRADEVLARLCRSWSRDTVSDNDALVLAAAIAAHTRINEASYLEVREFARPVFDALDHGGYSAVLERLDALAVAADEANRSRHEPSISPSPAGARLEPAPSSSAAPQAALSPYLLATSSTTTAKRPTRYRPYKPLSGERALRIILDVIASVKATQDYAAQDEARLFSIVDTARRTGMPGSTDAADLAEATRLYRHHSRELQAALRGLDVPPFECSKAAHW